MPMVSSTQSIYQIEIKISYQYARSFDYDYDRDTQKTAKDVVYPDGDPRLIKIQDYGCVITQGVSSRTADFRHTPAIIYPIDLTDHLFINKSLIPPESISAIG